MVRGIDNAGAIFLGFTRAEVERLLAGERICCDPAEHAPGPHLCIYGGEDDAAIIARIDAMYPLQVAPPARSPMQPYSAHPSTSTSPPASSPATPDPVDEASPPPDPAAPAPPPVEASTPKASTPSPGARRKGAR